MELLAPVGNIQNFHVALESGADAVYIGAPGFNARNLARDLQLDEIGAMIDYCHERDKKIYLAANSLILEKEIHSIVHDLALIEKMGPDGLIVQDMGLIRLINEFFPGITIHGSTLTTAHNSESVNVMANMGCERVVLARELTLKEIETIARKTPETELEIFIHGAMCFSYSGLCLFSSYLGGKSGLRGRCVQPCRRAYREGSSSSVMEQHRSKKLGKGGKNVKPRRGAKQKSQPNIRGTAKSKAEYLFSMNDLEGLEVVPQLQAIGIDSLKIEGRLRSAHYVEHVVRAYRTVMDSSESDFPEALVEAKKLSQQAMSRKTSPGYFFSPQPAEAISHLHSGNMGLHLGRFTKIEDKSGDNYARLRLKDNVNLGDRLRLHIEPGGDRTAFSLKELLSDSGKDIQSARGGSQVRILLPPQIKEYRFASCEVYKVDGKSSIKAAGNLPIARKKSELVELNKKQLGKIKYVQRETVPLLLEPIEGLIEFEDIKRNTMKPKKNSFKARVSSRRAKPGMDNLHKQLRLPMEWWLRLDSPKTILGPLPFTPDRFILSFDRAMIRQASQIKRYLGKNARQVIWALPPVILENDLNQARKNIKLLVSSGYRSFQIAHWSQLELFGREKVTLFGDYSLNFLNAQGIMLASKIGLESVQFSMETDRENLYTSLATFNDLTTTYRDSEKVAKIPVGMTVYGVPPLYTARLASSHFHFGRNVFSPKEESFVVRKKDGFTQTHPNKPFSLLPYLQDIKAMGVNYVVVDLSGGLSDARGLDDLSARFAGVTRGGKLPTFNYLGTLQ
ncbi:MAG: U32 family peptidase [Desulfotalea sp.]